VKFYLNSEFYPYDDLNLHFDKRRATILYDMYVHFHTSYYQIPHERNESSFQLLFERFYSSNYWLLVTKRIHQEWYCGCMIRIWIQRECTRIQPPIALSYTTAWSNITQCQMYTRLRKLSSSKNTSPSF